MTMPDRFLTHEPRQLTPDEIALANHVGRWGSGGYPVRRLGRRWTWDYLTVRAPGLFPTRKAAVANLDRRLDFYLDQIAFEAWTRAEYAPCPHGRPRHDCVACDADRFMATEPDGA